MVGAKDRSGRRMSGPDGTGPLCLLAALVHVWSTRDRKRAVHNGLQRSIVRQVAGAILGKRARVENPDKTPMAVGRHEG
jgi:hypothetical protein